MIINQTPGRHIIHRDLLVTYGPRFGATADQCVPTLGPNISVNNNTNNSNNSNSSLKMKKTEKQYTYNIDNGL